MLQNRIIAIIFVARNECMSQMRQRYKYNHFYFNRMKKIFEGSTVPPRHGYISEIAKLCNCNRKTVTRALFEGQAGKKSDYVRKVFHSKYK